MESCQQRHQEIREFVEARYPERNVTEIRENSRTSYRQALDGSFILTRLDMEYTVEAVPVIPAITPTVSCSIVVLHDGALHVANETLSAGF